MITTQYGVFLSSSTPTAEPPTTTTYTISSSGTGSDSGVRYSRVPVRRRKPDSSAAKNRRRRVNREVVNSVKYSVVDFLHN